MEQLFSGKVYEILSTSNGIVFSYLKSELDIGNLVQYKMISFDNKRMSNVTKNVYLMTKFGTNYKAVSAMCENYIETKSIVLPNGKVFLLHEDATAQLLDNDASPVWTGSLTYRCLAPSDIVLHKNALWACFEECNVLLRYNLATMREELRIGGNNSPFDKPRNLFVEGDTVTVSNQGSQKLVEVDLNNYSVLEKEYFEESVHQYLKVQNYRFVILDSGLYILD